MFRFGSSDLFAVLICALTLYTTTEVRADEAEYSFGPDSLVQPNVPQGRIEQRRHVSTKVFPGTERDYWIYIPAQFKREKPACLMVFQDGGSYVRKNGQYRTATVFDNLIHKGKMPVTIGVFINPGVIPPSRENSQPRRNRSFEYDSLGDQYARFLLEEFLPPLDEVYNISQDPEDRAVAGISSGAICAWTVAWERPNSFRKVLSHVGSFTNIRGGHNYHAMIRKTEKKPIRVFLQEGSNDLNNLHGSWPLANRQMASSLEFSGYDYKFVMGTGGHNGRHGGAILPESLIWLWRDHPDVKHD